MRFNMPAQPMRARLLGGSSLSAITLKAGAVVNQALSTPRSPTIAQLQATAARLAKS